MKYEITKGSEKDFEGAPSWAMVRFKAAYGDDVFAERFERGVKWCRDGSTFIGLNLVLSNAVLIAERRPITEPVWDGEGLPPAGVECEGLFPRHPGNSFEWQDCLVLYVFEHECAVKSKGVSTLHYCDQFRPIRSPEDVARSNAIGEMERAYEELTGNPAREAEEYYDLIAAGKIPCVKLEGK